MQLTRTKVDPKSLSQDARRFLASAFGFAVGILGLNLYDCTPEQKGQPYLVDGKPLECRAADGTLHYRVIHDDWQARFFQELDRHGARISLKTCNGAGKSSMCAAGAILWHMEMFPKSKTVVYSASHRQLQTQLWPAILQRAQVLDQQDWEFQPHSGTIRHTNGSIAIIFSTNDPGKAEGHHGSKAELYDPATQPGPLLVIIDEAKTVPRAFFEAFDRCTYQRLVYMSSTGAPEGDFWASQGSGSAFVKIAAPAAVCPHADHAKNAEVIAKRGLDHPLVKSTIFAEFMESAEDCTITWKDIHACLQTQLTHQPGRRVGFCDFAAGGDENAFAMCDGNKASLVKAWREKDTIKACAEFVGLFNRLRLQPKDIYGDASGLGAPMCDQLARMGWPINRVFNQSPARVPTHANIASQMWDEGVGAIRRREVILPDDETMLAQLAGRKWNTGEDGKIRLESKDDMKERGLESPDRAEAVLGAMFWAGAHAMKTEEDQGWLPKDETYQSHQRELVEADAGI